MSASAKPASPLRSAEFVVAIALLAVCIAVGGAYWLLSARDGAGDVASGSADTQGGSAPDSKGEERAALESWKQKLQGDFATLDKERQLQAQRSELDRRRQETDAEAERLEQLRAAAVAAAAKLQPAAAPTPPAPPVQVATAAPKPVPAALAAAAHEAVRTEASVDWGSCSHPQYPRASVDNNEEGLSVLSFKVSAAGEAQGGKVSDSSGSARLDEAALRALEKCRFKPATVDGTAVAATATVKFRWQLGK
jgi:periplasmic protein TonB